MSYKTGFKNGRLGIGLPESGGDGNGDPLYPLDINGDIRLTGAIVKADGTIYSSGGGVGVKGLYSVQDSNTGKYKFGVGKSNPVYTLDISGSLNLDGDIYVNGVSLSSGESTTASQALQTGDDPSWINNVVTEIDFDELVSLPDNLDTLKEIALVVKDISESAVSGLTTTIDTKSNIANPTFTGMVTIPDLTLTGQLYESDGVTPRVFSNWTVHSNGNDLYRSSGNVGIGTTDPKVKLNVEGGGFLVGGNDTVTQQGCHIQWNRSGNHGETHIINNIGGAYNNGESSGIIFAMTDSNGTVSDKMFIRNDGNVGIGRTDPTQVLDVKFPTATSGSDPLFIQATRSGLSNAGVGFRAGDGTWHAFWEHTHGEPDRMNFGMYRAGNGKQVYMTLTHEGRLGIGTTTPNHKLEIKSNHSQLRLMDSDDNKYCSLSFSSSFLAIRINSINSSDFIIKEGGNIGIGTTSPGSKLEIYDNSPAGQVKDILHVKNYDGYDMVSLGTSSNFNSGQVTLYKNTATKASANEGVVINANGYSYFNGGNVGIGTTTPLTNIKFSIVGNSGGTSNLAIQNTTATTTGFLYLQMNDDGKAYVLNSTNNPLILGANNQGRLVLNNNGNVGIGTTNPETLLTLGNHSYTDGTRDLLRFASYRHGEAFTIRNNDDVSTGRLEFFGEIALMVVEVTIIQLIIVY